MRNPCQSFGSPNPPSLRPNGRRLSVDGVLSADSERRWRNASLLIAHQAVSIPLPSRHNSPRRPRAFRRALSAGCKTMCSARRPSGCCGTPRASPGSALQNSDNPFEFVESPIHVVELLIEFLNRLGQRSPSRDRDTVELSEPVVSESCAVRYASRNGRACLEVSPQLATREPGLELSGRARRVARVTKLDWSKAKPKSAPEPRDKRRESALRQTAIAAFVSKHELACFKCGSREGEWAKTGRSRRGPWAICAKCVRG